MSVYLFLINIFYSFLDLFCYMSIFESKYNKIKSGIFYLAYNSVLLYIGLFSDMYNNISSAAIIIAMCLYAILGFKNKFSEKLAGFLMFYSVCVTLDYLSYTIGSLLTSGDIHFICTIILAVLKPLMVAYFIYVWKAVKTYGMSKKSLIFVLLPVLQSASCQFMISFTKTAATHKEYRDTLDAVFSADEAMTFGSVAVMIVFILIDALAFKGFIDNLKMTRAQAQMQIVEYQNEINYKYYKEIKENALELKKIRHDINNILQCVYSLIYNLDNYESQKAKELYEGLKSRAEKLNVVSFCSDELINALVSAKKTECENLGVDFEPMILIPPTLDIEEIDLFRCVCNLLDNAIEAQTHLPETKDKFVRFTMKLENGILYISTKNSISQAAEINKKMRTTKKDKASHGYGLSIIEEISKKYSGDFIVNQNGSECDVVVTLQAKL